MIVFNEVFKELDKYVFLFLKKGGGLWNMMKLILFYDFKFWNCNLILMFLICRNVGYIYGYGFWFEEFYILVNDCLLLGKKKFFEGKIWKFI